MSNITVSDLCSEVSATMSIDASIVRDIYDAILAITLIHITNGQTVDTGLVKLSVENKQVKLTPTLYCNRFETVLQEQQESQHDG